MNSNTKLRPAHEVVVDLFMDAVGGLSAAYKKESPDEKCIGIFTGRLLAAIYMLRRMVIPQKHLQEIAEKLRAVDIPPEVKGKVLVQRLLTHIVDDNLEHYAAQVVAKSAAGNSQLPVGHQAVAETIAGPPCNTTMSERPPPPKPSPTIRWLG